MGLTVNKVKTHNNRKLKRMSAPKANIMRSKKKGIKTKASGGGW